ncbi:MAG: glycosyltransferase family 39 protein [Candidatus Promineifilaceae bacterium]|nr:glycosyltransferase family 39 protein [Candidatus Promineifilaceae bacterium]
MHGQEKSDSHPRRWLILILIAYTVLGLAYSLVIPLAETPDESEHFRYLQAIARTGRLPVMLPEREANLTLEAHQPPLYYLLGTAVTAPFDLDPADNPPENSCFSFEPADPGRKTAYLHSSEEWPPARDLYRAFTTVRLFSVLMGAAAVAVAYLLGRQAVPTVPMFAPVMAALVAFNPQFIFITASMNNDVPTTLLGALMVALTVSAITQPRLSTYLALGIVTGLGILTKFALIAFWPLALVAAVWPALQLTRSPLRVSVNWSDLPGRLLLLLGLPLLIAGWWYLRNYQLYGDPLMWDVTLAAKGSVIARTSPFTLADLWEFIALHFQSFWLWFGWLNIKAPEWIYALLLLIVLLAVAGLIRWLRRREIAVELPALAMNALAVLAIYASLLQYIQTINWTGYQGRLAFAALASVTLFLTLGLFALGGQKLGAGIGVGLFVLSVGALLFILLPAYPRPDIFRPEPHVMRTCARFAGGLQVEAVAGGDSVRPGESLPVTIFGYGLADAVQAQEMSLRLHGKDGEVVAQATADLEWRAKEVVEVAFELHTAADAHPARAVLDLALIDEQGEFQTAASATGRVLEVPVALRTVKLAPAQPFVPEPMVTAAVNFGDQLTLVGYDLDLENDPLLTLYWLAQEEMDRDYTTFLHILDAEGQLVAQEDSQPTAGVYPTSIWDKGEIVADQKELDRLDLSADQGLQLVVGVYLLETLERLPVRDASGAVQPNDQWALELADTVE